MNLSRLIIHEIKKEAKSKEATLINSKKLIPIDYLAINLIEALRTSYNSDHTLHAEFDKSITSQFPIRYDTFNNSNRNDDNFIEFTSKTVGNLLTKIRAQFLARGGYVLFSEYVNLNRKYISIFLIRDVKGQVLIPTGDSFKINTTEYLDTEHLAMACRIDEGKLANNELNYLTFTSKKQKDVSDYFLDWLCAKELKSSTEYTKALREIINTIDRPLNPVTNKEYTKEEFSQEIVKIAKTNPQKKINLHILSEHFYDDKLKMTNFANENNISIGSEFRYNERHLRRFTHIHIAKDGISLNFSRNDLKKKIKLGKAKNTVIINSKELADSLRSEINYDGND